MGNVENNINNPISNVISRVICWWSQDPIDDREEIHPRYISHLQPPWFCPPVSKYIKYVKRREMSVYIFISNWHVLFSIENEKPNPFDSILFKIKWHTFFEFLWFIHNWRQNDSWKRSRYYEYDIFQGWLQAGSWSSVWRQEGPGSGGAVPC